MGKWYLQSHSQALRKWGAVLGCAGCCCSCIRIWHPSLSILNTTLFWSLSFHCCAWCQATACLPPPPAFFPVALYSLSGWLVSAPGGFCCLASASTETSPGRVRNCVGLTLFGAGCRCGVLRLNHLGGFWSQSPTQTPVPDPTCLWPRWWGHVI